MSQLSHFRYKLLNYQLLN